MMNVNVLRLDHRIGRDTRITTHVCLTSRAFGASKIYLSGEEDHKLMENVETLLIGGEEILKLNMLKIIWVLLTNGKTMVEK